MKLQIQQGIDARPFAQLMYELAVAGQGAQEAAKRARHAELEKLAPAKGQRGLFDEEEATR